MVPTKTTHRKGRTRVRLSRLIAQRGVASRRDADRLVQDGRVTVNGQVAAEPGLDVDPERDHVKVDGKRLPPQPSTVVLLLHKPPGTVTTEDDPEERDTVLDLLEGTRYHGRVHPVGRLDYGSEGVLLLTNDGDLAYRLTHPRYHVPKVYVVKVTGDLDERKARSLRRGVPLPDGRTAPAGVEIVEARGRNTWVRLLIHEGRNRIVRRMMEFVGHRVLKLRRESFAGVELGSLPRGEFRVLDSTEVQQLRQTSEQGVEVFARMLSRMEARQRRSAAGRSGGRSAPRGAGRGGSRGGGRGGTRGGKRGSPRGGKGGGPRGAAKRGGRKPRSGGR